MFKKLVVAICATIVIALVGEAILRVAGIVPVQSLDTASLDTFNSQPGIWEPDQTLFARDVPSLPFTINTNSLGYRGGNFDIEKKPDEFRVFMAGDSYTFGNNVNETDTLPFQLQRELNHACEEQDILTINAGIPGSTIRSQAEMIRRGMPLQPDMVILVFTETDIVDLTNPLWDVYSESRNAKAGFPASLIWPWVSNTSTYTFLSKIRSRFKLSQRLDTEKTLFNGADQSALRDTYLHGLREITSELASNQVDFMVVIYPGNYTVRNEPYDDVTPWAIKEFATLGIPVVELLTPLQEALGDDSDSAYLLPVDGHPSKLGYQVAASAIAKQMLSETSLADSCLAGFTETRQPPGE